MSWWIFLTDPRADAHTDEMHQATADKLRMARRDTTKLTIAAYVRGEDGHDPDDRGQRIDPVLAAIAAHHGIVPLRLLRAQRLGLGFEVGLLHDQPAGSITSFDDIHAPYVSGISHLGRGITYSASPIEEPSITLRHDAEGDMPETIRTALVGQPLSALVRIPGLDGDPVIQSAERRDGYDMITLSRMDDVACGR